MLAPCLFRNFSLQRGQQIFGDRKSALIWPSRCFIRRCSRPALGSSVGPQQMRQMEQFIDLLLEQNRTMNLTAIKTKDEAWERHVQDSLSLLPLLDDCMSPEAQPARIVDIGSGAGLPGLIIALARPQWQAFDIGIARAVAEMRTLVELSLPLIRVGGHLVAAKGPNPEVEVEGAKRAIAAMGGQLQQVSQVESFGPLGQRCAVIVKKVAKTPSAYPRDNGLPKKKPL